MKHKEHNRMVRDEVVEKFKAWLRYEKEPELWRSHRALFNSSPENGTSMAQLQTYQDINWQAGRGEHWSEKQQTAEIHSSAGRICPQDNY